MCGRFFLVPDLHELLALLDAMPEGIDDLRGPRWNIPPTMPIVVMRPGDAGPRSLAPARWGLVPTWWRDPDKLPSFHNARAETAATKPSFRGAVRYRRVIIPATGFYEWDRARGRTPFSITRSDGDVMAFAGIGTVYSKGPHVLETAAILTVDASPAMRGTHDRMPVILERDAWDAWTDPRASVDDAMAWCTPKPEGLDVVEVGTGVNNARNTDGRWFESAIAPVAAEDGP